MARLTWQVSPRNKISAYFDEIDKYRGHDMQANYDPETAATVWNSPAYHTTAIKWTSPVTSSLFLEAGFSNNTEYYTNEYREGIEKPHGTAEWYRKRGARTSSTSAATRRPARSTPPRARRRSTGTRAATYVTGASHHQVRRQQCAGASSCTRVDANADLVQQYRGTAHRRPAGHGARHVLIRNSPLVYGEKLNKDLGIYHPGFVAPQPPDGERRHPLGNAELVGDGGRVAGRPLRAGAHVPRNQGRAELERLRAAPGPGLRPVRQRQDRDQVLAEPLQPVAHHRHRRQLQPAAVADRDAAVGRRERRRHRPGLAALPTSRAGLRNQLRQLSGELRHRRAERIRRVPAHLEPRAGRRGLARAARRPVGRRARGGRATSTT